MAGSWSWQRPHGYPGDVHTVLHWSPLGRCGCPCGCREGRSLASTDVNLNKKSVCGDLFSIIVLLSPVRVFFFSSIECSTYLVYWRWSWGLHRISIYWNMHFFLSFNYYLLFLALLSSHSIYSKYKYSQGWHIGTFHDFSADILEFPGRGEAVEQDTAGGLSSPSKWGYLSSVLLSVIEVTSRFLIRFKPHSARQSSCLVLLSKSDPYDWLCHRPWGELSTNFLLNGHSNKLLLISWLYTHISLTPSTLTGETLQ